MGLPNWRRRQLEEKAQAAEQQAIERTAPLVGDVDYESPTQAYPHDFGGPHTHRCPQCREEWTHAVALCPTPRWFVVCTRCA